MDVTIENLIELLQNSTYMPSGKKEEALSKLEKISEDSDVPADLKDLIEELLEVEANKAAEAAENAEAELEDVESEISLLGEEQAERIQADLEEDIKAMNDVIEDHKHKVFEFEAGFEKEIEGEVSKGEEAEVDNIRKKLGIA